MKNGLTKRFYTVLVCIGFCGAVAAGTAAPGLPTEFQVEAAFLYNFAKFVEWPPGTFADETSPMIIGVIGEDPFGPELASELSGKTVGGRAVILKHLTNPKEALDCQVLFISSSEQVRLAIVLEALDNHPVLTISDIPHFIQKGGMLGFSVEDQRVRFSVNLHAAEKPHLKLSSELLKLARTVKT